MTTIVPAGARRRGRAWPRIVLSVVLLAAVLAVAGFRDVGAAWGRVAGAEWALAIGLFLISHLGSAMKWCVLVRLCGGRLAAATAIRCHALGLAANWLMPSLVGGDLLRAGTAIRQTGQSAAIVNASLADRALDFLGLAALVAVGVAASGNASFAAHGLALAAAVPAALVLGLALLAATFALARRVRPLSTWPPRARRFTLHAGVALRRLRRRTPATVGVLLAATALQAFLILINVRLAGAMGLQRPLAEWFALWPLAKLAAMFSPAIGGGAGVREWVFKGLGAHLNWPADLVVPQAVAWTVVNFGGSLVAAAWWGITSLRAVVLDRTRVAA